VKIKVVKACSASTGVDTVADLEKVKEVLEELTV
jgi:CMP-2-keto-3-deoxyoctulosonic acid synthetase